MNNLENMMVSENCKSPPKKDTVFIFLRNTQNSLYTKKKGTVFLF